MNEFMYITLHASYGAYRQGTAADVHAPRHVATQHQRRAKVVHAAHKVPIVVGRLLAQGQLSP